KRESRQGNWEWTEAAVPLFAELPVFAELPAPLLARQPPARPGVDAEAPAAQRPRSPTLPPAHRERWTGPSRYTHAGRAAFRAERSLRSRFRTASWATSGSRTSLHKPHDHQLLRKTQGQREPCVLQQAGYCRLYPDRGCKTERGLD